MHVRKTVAVLIAVHNRLHFTSRCITCLKSALQNAELRIIVIDDGSTDGTSEWLTVNAPDVRQLKGDGNLWFGGGTQMGIDYAKANLADVDYVMTLNNDAFVEPGCVDALIAESRGHSTVGALVLNDEDGHIHSFGDSWNWWKGWVDHVRGHFLSDYPDLERGTSRTVQGLNTSCTLIPMKWIKRIRGINTRRYPQHRADTVLLSQVRKAGSPLCVTSRAIALQDGGRTPLRYSIRDKPLWTFLRDSLTNRFYPVHLPTSLLSIWETAPNHLSALPVMTRSVLIYLRQLFICLLMSVLRTILGLKKGIRN